MKVEVNGDLQFKVDDWEWGDKLEFEPEYVYVAGTKASVVPLSLKLDLYTNLGWTDKMEKIKSVMHPKKRGR